MNLEKLNLNKNPTEIADKYRYEKEISTEEKQFKMFQSEIDFLNKELNKTRIEDYVTVHGATHKNLDTHQHVFNSNDDVKQKIEKTKEYIQSILKAFDDIKNTIDI